MLKPLTALATVAFFATVAYSVDGFAMDFCCRHKPQDTFETIETKSTPKTFRPMVSYLEGKESQEQEVAIKFMKEVIGLHQDGVISGLMEEELSLNEKTAEKMLENLTKQAIKKTELKTSLRGSEKKRNLNTSYLTMPMIQESFILGDLEEFDNEESKGKE